MGGFERGSRRAKLAAIGSHLVLMVASTWLAACPGLEVEFQKVGQEPFSERRPRPAPSLAELHEYDLIARLPPHEEQLSGSGGWRLNEVAQEIGRRAREGQLSDRAWVELLGREGLVRTRPRWPTNVPFEISLNRPHWIAPKRIVVEAIDPPIGKVEWSGRAPVEGCVINHGYRHLGFEALPPGTRTITFEVTIEGMTNPWSPYTRLKDEPRTSWKGQLKIPVEVVPQAADCLPSAKGPDIDAAVRESLYVRLAQGSIEPTWLGFEQGPEQQRILTGVGFSLVAALLNDGQLVERKSLRVENPYRTPGCPLEALPRKLAQDPSALAHWQVRVTGDPGSALSLWEADRWWDGELTIPLAELVERAW